MRRYMKFIFFEFTSRLTPLLLLLLISCSEGNNTGLPQNISSPPSITGSGEAAIKTVILTANQAADLDIQTYRIEKKIMSFPVFVPGIVTAAPDHIAMLSTPVDGRITRIFAHEGEEVTEGSPLLEMESLEYANLIANFLEAQAEMVYLQRQVERLSTLVDRNISTKSSLDLAIAELARAEARTRAARARLLALGIKNQEIEQLGSEITQDRAVITMIAPINGKINQHLIDLGQSVNANDLLLDILNNSRVLVRGFVNPEDVSFLKSGLKVIISQNRFSNGIQDPMRIESVINTIQPGLDHENRSVIVNSIVTTQNDWPVIGQSVHVQYEAYTPVPVLGIPISAVQFEGQSATVYVKRDDMTYESRPVILSRLFRDSALIESGLAEGEEVAITQIFSLKALGKFEEYSEE
jgi:membrane fusion protein, heavy metal efflux system